MDGFVAAAPEDARRYRADGYWTGEGLDRLLRDAAEPGAVAVVSGGRRHSYGELDGWADRLAAGWYERGLRPGDTVVVQLPNIVEFVVVSVALFRLGAPPVYALPAHRLHEITELARTTGARAYVVPDVFAGFDHRVLARAVVTALDGDLDVLVVGEPGEFSALAEVSAPPRPLPPVDPAGVAFFLLSGGTTGVPKLIPRTHDDYAYQLRICAEALGVDRHSVYLAALPAAHNAALGCPGVLGTLRAGGRVVMSPTPSPDDVFPLISDEGVTLTTLMPPLLPVWLELAEVMGVDLTGVLLEVGGAALRPEVAHRVLAAGCRLTHWFGMAEGVLWYAPPDAAPDVVAGTQGRPISKGDEYRVVGPDGAEVGPGQTGELLARGPMTLRGYYRAEAYNSRTFTPDGFLRTGDLVRLDPAGNLVVVGRARDVINRGGEKIGAEELEDQLESHPDIREAAVFAVPDPGLGEKICAVVVAGGEGARLDAVRAFLTGRGLAGYKLPDRLEVVGALPRTPVGKIDKKALLTAALAQSSR